MKTAEQMRREAEYREAVRLANREQGRQGRREKLAVRRPAGSATGSRWRK